MSWFTDNDPTKSRTGQPISTTQPVALPQPQTLANPAPNGNAGYNTDWGGGNVEQQQRQLADAKNGGGRPMQGFVQSKVADDKLGTSHKYVGGRILAAGGTIDDVLHDPMFQGWTKVGGDKIKGPAGSVYDIKNANGAVQWTAISGPAWDQNGIAGVNSLGVNSSMAHDGIKGNYAAANTTAADAAKAAGKSTFGYATSAGGGGGTLANPTTTGGPQGGDFAVSPWTRQFKAPTQEEATSDQGYQFALGQGRQALERSAAAKGTLLTTGTLQDLDKYSQGMASEQYGNVYNRAVGQYQSDYNDFTGNEGRRFQAHQANFGNNLATNQNNFNQGFAVNQNQFNQGLATNQNAFNQQFSLANMGLNAANAAGQYGSNYANQAGNLYTQQGNVNAAGQVAGTNATNGAIGNIANMAQYYAGLYHNQNNPPVNYNGAGPWAGGYQY